MEGPKWCGKTTTAEQLAKSVIYMDDPDKITEHITMANIGPRDLLLGDNPRLLERLNVTPGLDRGSFFISSVYTFYRTS